jgi:hypothetical protein
MLERLILGVAPVIRGSWRVYYLAPIEAQVAMPGAEDAPTHVAAAPVGAA